MHEKLQDDGKAEQGNRLEVTRYFLAMATNVNDGVLDIWRSRRDLLALPTASQQSPVAGGIE